ncbi:CYTH domain-containing protein [Dysgonomonas sp. 521]|uniref:CYTH domain-containing protein n=1 Tax=Dysgonomonas sp. 521 TaxID=2302932 RepID=UPI0013CF8DFA|nr:CYTH domain-containing protein [Dysgonomonas sp. 521]NDV95615.1 CYTH domain-containing protein [Dysgonomonas sp. 521]
MALEIERKFLVNGDFKQYASAYEEVVQGYLSSVTGRTVRVRIKGDKAYITIKGKSNESGVTRFEWEKEISITDARELLKLCEPGMIDKVRYYIRSGRHTFEVDEFHGENEGLIIAEIELSSEDEQFEKPNWLGKEVTGDRRYYNSSLVKLPYTKWQ